MSWVLKVDDEFAYLAPSGGWVRYQIYAQKFRTRSKVYTAAKEQRQKRRPFNVRIVKLIPKKTSASVTDHPWAVFLHHRARVLQWLAKEGKHAADIARDMTMDPGQVQCILAYAGSFPEDFTDRVAPVPIPMSRSLKAKS